MECHVDADFAGGWSSGDHINPEAVLSRTGFVISYAGCPVFWCSKLQSEITLSTTESKYVALSMAMREVLPFMNLMTEISDFLPVKSDKPNFFVQCGKITAAASKWQKAQSSLQGPSTSP